MLSIILMVREKSTPAESPGSKTIQPCHLILFNDEINSFEFVIKTLMDVCAHDFIQAEQCTWIAHFKGKCPVRSGCFDELKPMHDEMSNRGLTVSIES